MKKITNLLSMVLLMLCMGLTSCDDVLSVFDNPFGPSSISVISVELDADEMNLTVGGIGQLNVTVTPDNATGADVDWTSSDVSVATVDGSGLVTAVAEGTATITAKAGGKTATCVVTVKAAGVPVTSVTLDKTELALTVGDEAVQLTATVKPDNATDADVDWTSSDVSVATVDGSGLVTAVAEGTATITAKAGGKTATCVVTVKAAGVPVTSVTLDKTELALTVGDEAVQLTATVKPDNATDADVDWTSSDVSVATVDGSGLVTAVAEGTATITAKAGDKTAECKVTVKAATAAKTLAEATAGDIGKIVGADGKIYATKADAEAVATGNAVAMIAYVGSDTYDATYKNGLAIAQADEGSVAIKWSTAKSTCEGKTAITGAKWCLPSRDQWKQMFKANGGDEAKYSNLNTTITTAGGTELSQDYYWSSTEETPGANAYQVSFGGGNVYWSSAEEENSGCFARACLAF